MFSVDHYNAKLHWAEEKIIDNFFENLRFDLEDPVVDQTLYADLLSLVDTKNRWVYRGSVTTPPCAENVYWNVLTTVYPIKKKYVDQFKAKLNNAGIQENRRRTQPLTSSHNVIFLHDSNHHLLSEEKTEVSKVLIGIMGILGFFLILMCFAICFLGKKSVDLKR